VRNDLRFRPTGALIVAGKAASLRDGIQLAQRAIDDGGARATLARLVAVSNADTATVLDRIAAYKRREIAAAIRSAACARSSGPWCPPPPRW
jgi:thymidine phosphorylase